MPVTIEILKDPLSEIEGLTEILQTTVESGGCVNFILPFTREEARGFWERFTHAQILVARVDGVIAGTVSLVPARQPNQPHRADVAKLLVHPDFRRQGIARKLMEAIETEAQSQGRTLLTLDTRADDAAVPLYESLGYSLLGTIPEYALAPEGGWTAATFFYKHLGLSAEP